MILALFCPLELASSAFNSSLSLSRSTFWRSSLTDSAPMPARNAEYPKSSSAFLNSCSVKTCLYIRLVFPGSSTIYEAKYRTFSSTLGDISRIRPILLGIPLKYQICDTGAASSICPIRSLRTLDFVTSTPHLSQMIPLYLIFLYLPQ